MSHSVLIVEDDLRLRASLAQAIRGAPDLKLVGEADDLPEGLRLLDAVQPEVLLVDIGLPSGSGLELIRHAAKQSPHCNVMVITVFAEEQLVLDCIEAGATGYLLERQQSPGYRRTDSFARRRRQPDQPHHCAPPVESIHRTAQCRRRCADSIDSGTGGVVDERQRLQL